VGSNQYSSLYLRKNRNVELNSDLTWRKLDSSEGFTITHISDETVSLMRNLGTVFHGRRRINSVFGEGSSPRTRQIREGLNLLGIKSDSILRQSNKKKVYAIEMYEGAKEELLGFSDLKSAQKINGVDAIKRAWARRWLLPRLDDSHFLKALSEIHPNSIGQSLRARADIFETTIA